MRIVEWIESASPARLAVVAALFAALLLLPNLGAVDFVGDDEALDAGVVYTIHREGEWLHPEFNDHYLPPKPPLAYWLGAVVAAVRGSVDEWTVRAPSVFAAVATVAIIVAFGARAVGRGGAFLGGLFLALMPVFRDQARLGRADMTMTLLVVAALCLYGARREPLEARERWAFYVLLGLAALAKGAAGVGIVAAVVAADVWLGPDRRRARSLVHPSAVAFVAIGGFWYLLGVLHWGDRFLLHHVVGENFRHFFGSWVVEERPVRGLAHHLSHFVNVFTGTLPWGLFLPVAFARRGDGGEADDRVRFLRRWLVAGFVFFTLATRKSPYYLLPIFPPIALLVGAFAWDRIRIGADDRLDSGTVRRRVVLGAAAGLAVVALWLGVGAPGLGAERSGAVVGASGSWLSVLLVAVAGAALAVAATAFREGRARPFFAAALVAAFAVSQLANVVEPPLARSVSLRAFARAVGHAVPPGEPLYFFELPLPAVALYGDRTIPVLGEESPLPDGRFHLIVPESLAPRVPAAWGQARVLFEDRARVFTRRRMAIRLLELGTRAAGEEGDASPAAYEPPVRRRLGNASAHPPPGSRPAARG